MDTLSQTDHSWEANSIVIQLTPKSKIAVPDDWTSACLNPLIICSLSITPASQNKETSKKFLMRVERAALLWSQRKSIAQCLTLKLFFIKIQLSKLHRENHWNHFLECSFNPANSSRREDCALRFRPWMHICIQLFLMDYRTDC